MLATELQREREGRGWSVVELAERTGLTAQHIRRLESGTGSAASVEAVAQALELRLSHMPLSETLAGQVKAQRERRGWTISAFAATSGLSRMTVRSLESGGGSCESLNSAVIALAPKARFKAPAPASGVVQRSVPETINLRPATFWRRSRQFSDRLNLILRGTRRPVSGLPGRIAWRPAAMAWLNTGPLALCG